MAVQVMLSPHLPGLVALPDGDGTRQYCEDAEDSIDHVPFRGRLYEEGRMIRALIN